MVTAVVEEAIKMLHLIKRFFLAVLMLVISTVSSLTALAADKDIVILYTNDIHCAIDDNQGLAALSQYKKDMLAQTPYVALVDAGDAIQGSPIGKLSNGEVFTRLMNAVGYDFAIPGNHPLAVKPDLTMLDFRNYHFILPSERQAPWLRRSRPAPAKRKASVRRRGAPKRPRQRHRATPCRQ